VYSRGNARFAVDQMRHLGIVGNGPDATLGNFDMARLGRLIGIVGPIFSGQRKAIKANLGPGDVATNEFIRSTIGLR
jgi:hypothetical protein